MSEFNSEPIDIIVPWVNPNDPAWRKDFEYWKQKETGNKDACRYRDWGFIKYVFRSIEENCPWCRYVFLVLSGPSQIPDWLNVKCPKLKIVYHKDYIPEEFLPTFNSNVIELFYSRIEELSENFILCNDDTFFCKKMNEDFFFKNNIPVCSTVKITPRNLNNTWEKSLKNVLDFNNTILKQYNYSIYSGSHLQVCYNKSLQQFILYKHFDAIKSSLINSKFRQNKNLMHWVFYDLSCRLNKIIKVNVKGKVIPLFANTIINDISKPLICINEGELSSNRSIKSALNVLNKKFNKKSKFEV